MIMSKPSSPLKKVKVKSPKNFFQKNKNKEDLSLLDNHSPLPVSSTDVHGGSKLGSTHTSSHSDNGSYSEVDTDTPLLSNSTKKLTNINDDGSAFPTIPNLLSNDHNNNNNDDDDDNDDESVAAMSDIRERENSLDHSWNDSDGNEDEYFKEDYSDNSRVDVDKSSIVAVDGGKADGQNDIDGVNMTEITTNHSHGDGDDNIVDKNNITPQRANRGAAAAVAESTLSPNTPGSRVSFCDNGDKDFKTPPHLNRKIDVFATPTNENSIDETSLPLTPLEELKTPGGSTNAPKVLKQNKKLRAGRKELLKILGSTAKQFRVYEEVASQKIFELEERIRHLERRQWKSTASEPETTDNLSNELVEQQQQDVSKEKLISSLKLRCETLKHCLSNMEDELEHKRKVWESEVDMLSDALEKNNEALDYSVTQLERLRKWKTEQDQKEEAVRVVCTPIQSTENEEKPEKEKEEDKGRQELQLDSKSTSAMTEMEQTIAEKEQQIERLEGDLKEKGLDIAQLHTDLESCFNDIESLKELVNKTAAAKGYEDFQSIVDNLKDEAIKSESKAVAFSERISELESELQAKDSEILQLNMTIEEVQKSFVQHEESEASLSTTEQPDKCNIEVENKIKHDSSEHSNDSCDPIDNIKNSLLLSLGNDSVTVSTPGSSSPGASSPESRRWASLSFARKLAKEGRQYAAAVGSANDPESMLGMIRERDRRINSLEATIEANTLMIEKLKKDVERMDTEHEEAQVQSTQKIEQLEEENAVYLLQVEGFEKAFMTLNESQQTIILPSLDETSEEINASEKDDEVESKEDSEDLKAQNAKLERMLSELREECSFQEDQIEKLKTELTTLRVVSQQDKESACDKLRDENEIMEAQRSALENQLIEINKSAAMLRDSLAQDSTSSPSKSNRVGDDQIQNAGQAGSNPILVAQVVMLENANKVLESSIESLRSDQQEKLAPLLERIALLEEEKRIMEEEMHTKIHCREQTISNLEDSLKKATQSRLTKKKKNSALKMSHQLLARATKATAD
ncbi:hypothetical protein ACHAWT_000965 [Skeletonema menzelii]